VRETNETHEIKRSSQDLVSNMFLGTVKARIFNELIFSEMGIDGLEKLVPSTRLKDFGSGFDGFTFWIDAASLPKRIISKVGCSRRDFHAMDILDEQASLSKQGTTRQLGRNLLLRTTPHTLRYTQTRQLLTMMVVLLELSLGLVALRHWKGLIFGPWKGPVGAHSPLGS
jgi:hypothetical protein